MITRPEVFNERRIPGKLVHRESEVQQLSRALNPALQGERPEDVLISGPSGVGKTVLARYLLDNDRIAAPADSVIIPALGETPGSILRDAIKAHPSGPDVHRGVATAKLPGILRDAVDAPYVIILDEADDLHETDVLDQLASVPGLAIIAIAHDPTEWLAGIDQQHRPRFSGEHHIALDKYTNSELADILQPRADQGLEHGAVDRDQLEAIADVVGDRARNAIQTLKWAARLAEQREHDTIQQADIVDGRHEAQREIRKQALESLPYHHHVCYEIIRALGPVQSQPFHERYDAIAASAYAGSSKTPIERRARELKLQKLTDYGLIEWETVVGNNREYRVVDAEIASDQDIPVLVQ